MKTLSKLNSFCNLHFVINRFCKHKDNKIWSVFENGDAVRDCNKCGKRYNAENIGTVGYLGWLMKVSNGL